MTLVLIDTDTLTCTRYVDGKKTHQAMASGGPLDRQMVEDFRVTPPEVFLLIVSPEAARC